MGSGRTILAVGCGVSLLAGVFLGGFVERVILGKTEAPVSLPAAGTPLPAKECPPCPVCPSNPSTATQEAGEEPGLDPAERAAYAPEDEDPIQVGEGLPAAAVPIISAAVRKATATCPAPGQGNQYAVLDLVATASTGAGRVRDATVVSLPSGESGDESLSELERCLTDAALSARFEWTGPDGQLRIRLPLKLTREP